MATVETFGSFRYRLAKTPVGAGRDEDTVNGLINQVIERIARMFPWSRLKKSSILQTVAAYETGTVDISAGGTALTGTSTVWTSAMTGRLIRLASRLEYYTFTYVSATSGTIDRALESTTNLDDVGYTIWQPIVELPSDLQEIKSIRNLALGMNLEKQDDEWLNRVAASRTSLGDPVVYIPVKDSSSGLPQVELYPGPELAQGFPLEYKATAPLFDLTSATLTDTEFPDWFSIPAVWEGVRAELYAIDDKFGESAECEKRMQARVAEMINEDARRRPSSDIPIADRYAAHRVDRILRRSGGAQLRNWREASET